MLPKIVAISAALLKGSDVGKAFVDVPGGKILDEGVDDENETVDSVKLDWRSEVGANDIVTEIDVSFAIGRV